MITHNIAYTNYNPMCTHIELNKNKHLQAKNDNSNNQKQAIYDWLNHYKFTHFFTLRFQKHNETEHLILAEQQLRRHMALFEKKLLGRHWNHKHLFFLAFAEKGKGEYWHFHILFKFDGISEKAVINALATVEKEMKLSQHSMCLDIIDHLPETVVRYSTKEIKFDNQYKGDTSTIIPSTTLFDLAYAQTYHCQFTETPPKIAPKCVGIEKLSQPTNQQIDVTEEVEPEKQQSVLRKLYNKSKSLFTAPLNYVTVRVCQCLLYYVYTLPVEPYYIHRLLYEDSEDTHR